MAKNCRCEDLEKEMPCFVRAGGHHGTTRGPCRQGPIMLRSGGVGAPI